VNAAAVVVRWRGGDEVDRCLRSLLEHGAAQLRRIVLVDSGSGDGGAEQIARDFEEVEVLALAENRSFGWAAGRGVERCDEDLLLILNPDAALSQGSLGSLCDALADRPEAAGVVPLLVDSGGRPQHRWQLRQLPGGLRLAAGLPGAPQFPAAPPERIEAVEQPAAAAWLIRREVWVALEGLDPAFAPAWWEDVDFCARLKRSLSTTGFPARQGFSVVPEARIHHLGGSSLSQLSQREFLAVFYGNLLRYAERHHRPRLGLIRLGLRLSLIGRCALRPHRTPAYLGAMGAISGMRREAWEPVGHRPPEDPLP
jgi:GT2 family glycosyltransferase